MVPHIAPFPTPREQVAERLRVGIPLLHQQPAVVDAHFASELFGRLEKSAALERAWRAGALEAERLFGEAFVQHHAHVAELARAARVDSDELYAVAGEAVAPLLRAYAERLAPLVTSAWQRGYCPICGAWPAPVPGAAHAAAAASELPSAASAVAMLHCPACASTWSWPLARGCPWCGAAQVHGLNSGQLGCDQRLATPSGFTIELAVPDDELEEFEELEERA